MAATKTKPSRVIDPRLKDWATPRQAQLIDAVNAHGSGRAAARELGICETALRNALRGVGIKAALAGYSPAEDMTHTVPSPFVVKGVSSYYDRAGQLQGQWVKTKLDDVRAEEAIRTFIAGLVEEAKGKSPKIAAPKHTNADLLAVYPMGDPHFGMYAWAAECGEDFDTDVAERLTVAAIDRLVDSAPPAETALVVELGDFFHMDNSTNQTGRSFNALDVDTRWARVMQIGLRAMVYTVKRALGKHAKVVVRIVGGNHDPHSSFALALALDAYFENQPRVTIDLSPAPFWYYRFGNVLIGSTHGDKTKIKDLPGIMAADRAEDWGGSKYRYWYQGHIHHEHREEFPGCVVEAFRTLAARDAWHTGAGYRAGRDMRLIVHHKQFGEIERHRCDVAMIDK
jgi:NAD(P)-dependent dehydrogenase (short-subunit alcohol dehydrogenase family)